MLTSISLSLCLFLFVLVQCSLSANILILSTVPSVSHSIWNQKLAKILADRHHQITVLDAGSSVFNHKNITHIELVHAFNVSDFDLNYFSTKTDPIFATDILFDWMHHCCEAMLKYPAAKIFLNKYKGKKSFDLIILDGACCESFLGFVEMFGSPPLVQATAFGAPTYLMELSGNYDNPSYVPYSGSPFFSKMNFMERVENTLYYLYFYYRFYKVHMHGQNKMAREFFGDKISNVEDLSRKSIITLLNIHPALDGVKPMLPNIIPIGGFHIDPVEPLEKDLQTFLDSSKNGAIYFSFGTNLKCDNMDDEKFNLFVETFREINHNVLWKCERTITNLPKNLRLGKWFKQSDVLAHPNVKLFISHGGLLGTQEALYHGVPILVMPFIVDQHFIAKRLEKMGIAISLTYSNLTKEKLMSTINQLFTDQSFQDRMKERSIAFRDNPISPRDLAVFWIEYVLRHPHTNLLRSETQTMSIYQILLLDVIGFFIVIFIVIIVTLIITINIFCKIWKKTTKNKVKTN